MNGVNRKALPRLRLGEFAITFSVAVVRQVFFVGQVDDVSRLQLLESPLAEFVPLDSLRLPGSSRSSDLWHVGRRFDVVRVEARGGASAAQQGGCDWSIGRGCRRAREKEGGNVENQRRGLGALYIAVGGFDKTETPYVPAWVGAFRLGRWNRERPLCSSQRWITVEALKLLVQRFECLAYPPPRINTAMRVEDLDPKLRLLLQRPPLVGKLVEHPGRLVVVEADAVYLAARLPLGRTVHCLSKEQPRPHVFPNSTGDVVPYAKTLF